MSDIINLLPEALANQIAAGEVVQRPSSVVKELLENAIDAGATELELIVKDAGKSLIQVVDNGKGMSDTDVRMCFERHATSKLKTTEDLFNIRTICRHLQFRSIQFDQEHGASIGWVSSRKDGCLHCLDGPLVEGFNGRRANARCNHG